MIDMRSLVLLGAFVALPILTARAEVDPSPSFADVPGTHFAYDWITALHKAGITEGCGTAP